MRFLLFAGNIFYAGGGLHDFESSHISLEAAVSHGEYITSDAAHEDEAVDHCEWYHVVDLNSLEIVAESEEQAHGWQRGR